MKLYLICIGLIIVAQVRCGAIPKEDCIFGECDNNIVHMAIPLVTGTVMLNLKRSDVVNASIPVYLGTERYALSRWQGNGKKEDFVVYEDQARDATIVMWTEIRDDEQKTGMRGIFQDGGKTYELEPRLTRQPAGQDPIPGQPDNTVVITINNIDLTITRAEDIIVTEAEQRATEENEAVLEQIRHYMNEVTEQGHAFPKYYYEVELFLVIDYAIFDKWVRRSKYNYYRDREADAIDNIRFYYAHVMQGFNQRYRSVEDESMRITIRPVGIYIAKTQSASYWTEGYGIKDSSYYTEADRALDAFEEWINIEDLKLPPFDQATLFTGNFMYAGFYNNGDRRRINGLADIQGICAYKRGSISRDRGVYANINTGAHELAHNLGAFHDGYDNDCISRDQYLMAVTPGNVDDNNRDNTDKFSYCTKNYFREYLLLLNSRDENCLLTRDNSNEWYFNNLLTTKPGERYSVDEQCMIIYGSQSFYCGGGHNDDGICDSMSCWRPSTRSCIATPEQKAGDRTSCGERKWCVEGQCVYDSRAPRVDDADCVYGDYQDVVADQRKCYDLGINEPYRCYQDRFRSECCETCKKIERKDAPTCPYGDKNPSYCRDRLKSSDCYHESIRDTCCETCARLRTGGQGCEYGDKASHCRTMSLHRCYDEGDTCCQRCSNPPSTTLGCEWGDKVSWCNNIDTRSCSNPSTRDNCCSRCRDYITPVTNGSSGSSNGQACSGGDQSKYCNSIITFGGNCYRDFSRCCQTCASHFTNDPECKYGDKLSWCKEYVERTPGSCTGSYVKDNCCQACSKNTGQQNTGDTCTDKANWCRNIEPGQCYDEGTRAACCKTCKGYDKGTSTCRYGNAVNWCKPQYCPNEKKSCCETCR